MHSRHGCDYKGYGAAMSKSPRLDLSAYDQEDISQRTRPVVQDCTPDCRLPTIGAPCPRSLTYRTFLPRMVPGLPSLQHVRRQGQRGRQPPRPV